MRAHLKRAHRRIVGYAVCFVLLAAAPASAGRVGSLTACGGYSKLDLGCAPPSSAPLLTVRSGDPRYAGNALTVRFGGPSRPRQGKFEAFLGGFGPRALFLAAVILALL